MSLNATTPHHRYKTIIALSARWSSQNKLQLQAPVTYTCLPRCKHTSFPWWPLWMQQSPLWAHPIHIMLQQPLGCTHHAHTALQVFCCLPLLRYAKLTRPHYAASSLREWLTLLGAGVLILAQPSTQPRP
jgi:hypothetical protein